VHSFGASIGALITAVLYFDLVARKAERLVASR
jgi:hypothetical protein